MRVKTEFKASDDTSRIVRKIGKNTAILNKSIQRGFRKSRKSALGFKGVLKGILAAGAISKGFGLLSRGVGEVARQFVSFDDAITSAGAKFSLSGKEAGSFDQIMKNIKASAREAGATTIFTATQSAKALEFLARAGFTSTEAMGSLNSMINLSVATGEDFARAADISSDLLGSFGLASENSAKKLSNLNRLNNLLVATANSANVNLENMFDTMKDVGPIATEVLGVGLEKVFAITGALGDAGLKGTKGMTALKGIMLSLGAPTSEGGKVLGALGVNMFDIATGKPRDIITVMKELRVALNELPKGGKVKAIKAIFGKIPLAGAALFLRDIEKIRGTEKRLEKVGEISQETSDIMGKSLGNRLKGLGSALNELGFKALDPFEKRIKSNITALTEFFRARDPKPLTDSINSVVETTGRISATFEKAGVFAELEKTLGGTVKNFSSILGLTKQLFGLFETKGGFNLLAEMAKAALLPLKTINDTIALIIKGIEFLAPKKVEVPTSTSDLRRADEEAQKLNKEKVKKVIKVKAEDLLFPALKQAATDSVVKTVFFDVPTAALKKIWIDSFLAAPKGDKLQSVIPKPTPEPIQPPAPVAQQTNLNVDVTTNVNAEGVTADTTVKAPGTTGTAGINKF